MTCPGGVWKYQIVRNGISYQPVYVPISAFNPLGYPKYLSEGPSTLGHMSGMQFREARMQKTGAST